MNNKNWTEISLSDVIQFAIGGDWGKDPILNTDNDFVSIRCIRGSELRDWEKNKGNTASERKIKIASATKRQLIVGDIILEISGGGPDQPVGRTAYIDKDVLDNFPSQAIVCTNFFRLIRLSDEVNKRYFEYYLKYFYKSGEVVNYQGGSNNLRNLRFNDYTTIKIPLSPLKEQNRIVDKLDTLFAKIDIIKVRMDTIPQLIKQFRQSVLHAAVTGKLTEVWRENNIDCMPSNQFLEDLIVKRKKRYNEALKLAKQEKTKKPKKDYELIFNSHDSINTWAKVKLDQLIYISARIGWKGLKASEYTEEGPLFISVHSLNYGEKVDFSKAFHISTERYDESPEIKLENKDILLCKDGAGIGKIAYVEDLSEKATVNSSLLIIRSQEAFNFKYLYYFFSGPSLQRIVQERMTGSAVPHLFQRDIREFFIDMPPLEEQSEIVRRVDILFSIAGKLEDRYEKVKEQIDVLPQAFLTKAFKGELVHQDPNDEPVEKLLERILDEKARLDKKVKKLKTDVLPKAAEPTPKYKR